MTERSRVYFPVTNFPVIRFQQPLPLHPKAQLCATDLAFRIGRTWRFARLIATKDNCFTLHQNGGSSWILRPIAAIRSRAASASSSVASGGMSIK